jgi:CDP-diacylglycerol--glycerol-3-phosphate 3-phosphatidyltransferase
MFNVPILLTWGRVAVIPVLVALYYLPGDREWTHTRDIIATALFIGASITDWVDGWLARKTGQTSAFGAFLDPVADKLLVCSALLLLIELERVNAFIGLIIIGREITISALREWLAGAGKRSSVAVNNLGKLKTIAQMVAIPMLLFHEKLLGINMQWLGGVLIVVAAVLTVWSMVYYLWLARAHFRAAMQPDKPL